jgi:hypothetical protein
MPPEQRRCRRSGGESAQALGQAQLGPHWHWGPQGQAICPAGCWQPQLQVAPGQSVQGQLTGFTSFMVSSFELIDDEMSSMHELSQVLLRRDRHLRRVARTDA